MTNPYSHAGTFIPKMFGRKRMFENICFKLEKEAPAHLSIVAPKKYGKTILLHHLYEYMLQKEGFLTAVFVDLRHNTPKTDQEFYKHLAVQLAKSFAPVNKEYADELRTCDDESIPDLINLILDELVDNNNKILIIFDSFESLPLGLTISRSLVDQLRTFADKNSSLRYVIGSRRRLRELCKSDEIKLSNFWEIFDDPPVDIGAFNDDDLETLWSPFQEKTITVEAGAKTSLKSQSGGVPIIVAAMMRTLFDSFSDNSKITHTDIIDISNGIKQEPLDSIIDLWENCTQELQSLLVEIAINDVAADLYPVKLIKQATMQGFIKKEGTLLKSNCSIVNEIAKNELESVQDISRLFGKREGYDKNIKRILELRLKHINKCSDELTNKVKNAIKALDDGPSEVLNCSRPIFDEAIKVICTMEGIVVGQKLPGDWTDYILRYAKKPEDESCLFGPDRGVMSRYLQFLTGAHKTYNLLVTKKMSKKSYYLLTYLNGFGNFNTHSFYEEPSTGMAVLTCLMGIELIESLANDSAS